MAFKRKKYWKIYLLILSIVLLAILISSFLLFKYKNVIPTISLFAQKNVTKPYINPTIYEDFNNSEEGFLYLRVYVSKPEYRDIVINSIPRSGIDKNTVSSLGFTIEIRKYQLNNLTENPYIKRIYTYSHAPKWLDSKISLENEKLYVEPEVYIRLEEGGYVGIHVDAYSNEERDKIINSLPKSEEIIISVNEPGEVGFVAMVSREGLDKILKMPGVRMISGGTGINRATQISESAGIINATTVWNIFNLTGKNNTICVIDTGINKTHQYIPGKVLQEYCFCGSNIFNGCCPNGLSQQDGNGSALEGNFGHGTHVARIVASSNKIAYYN